MLSPIPLTYPTYSWWCTHACVTVRLKKSTIVRTPKWRCWKVGILVGLRRSIFPKRKYIPTLKATAKIYITLLEVCWSPRSCINYPFWYMCPNSSLYWSTLTTTENNSLTYKSINNLKATTSPSTNKSRKLKDTSTWTNPSTSTRPSPNSLPSKSKPSPPKPSSRSRSSSVIYILTTKCKWTVIRPSSSLWICVKIMDLLRRISLKRWILFPNYWSRMNCSLMRSLRLNKP